MAIDNIYVTNKLTNMITNVAFKIDSDNDLYEITVNNTTYTLDNVYDSPYGDLFDELNILIDNVQ